MVVLPLCHLLLGTALLGSLACAAPGPDRELLLPRRIAELDQLGLQAGMPDTYMTRHPRATRPLKGLLP